MPYDKQSFLSGVAVGRNMESWPALNGARRSVYGLTVAVDITINAEVELRINGAGGGLIPSNPEWEQSYDVAVNWGDGSVIDYQMQKYTPLNHIYDNSGTYNIFVFGLPLFGTIVNGIIADRSRQLVSVNTPFPSYVPPSFADCHNLQSIDPGVFDKFRELSVDYEIDGGPPRFEDCRLIQTIPGTIYNGLRFSADAISLNEYASDCFLLSEIGDGLFDNMEFRKVTRARGIFENCHLLKEVPADLFHRFENTTTFARAFYNAGIEVIPRTLFRNCHSATNFSNCFSYCPISDIPERLFDDCESAADFSYCFYQCPSLTEIPESLFDNCPNAENFSNCFYRCTQVVGEVPPLWEMFPDAIGTQCFSGCTQASNWNDIPSDWK